MREWGAEMGEKMSDMVDWKISKWLSHVERISGELLTKRLHESEVDERRG